VGRERSGSGDAAQGQQDSAAVGRWIRNLAIPLFLVGVTVISAIAFRGNRQQPEAVSSLASQDQPVLQPTPSINSGSALEVVSSGDSNSPEVISLISSQPSWVSIRNRSKDVVFEGTLNEPKQFEVDQGLEVFAGRPDLVRISYGDASPRALGSIDQLRWYPLTPEP
jgi:hypothetical protein